VRNIGSLTGWRISGGEKSCLMIGARGVEVGNIQRLMRVKVNVAFAEKGNDTDETDN